MHCKTNGKEKANTKNKVTKTFVCKEKVTFDRKKYDTSAAIKDTVLADDNRAIVLIVETAKIFWLRKSEYSPNAYNVVITILVRKRAGTRK